MSSLWPRKTRTTRISAIVASSTGAYCQLTQPPPRKSCWPTSHSSPRKRISSNQPCSTSSSVTSARWPASTTSHRPRSSRVAALEFARVCRTARLPPPAKNRHPPKRPSFLTRNLSSEICSRWTLELRPLQPHPPPTPAA
uniref:(northern house mosquito) hypothetical protein n=1 Tax=Culex pipiens TaxID=7175 RepID=A0A8D8DHA2_CULPI